MYLKSLEINGFKSFGKKAILSFDSPISAIVGPNGSGKSNIAEAFRFVLGEQSFKSMRGKRGEDLIFGGTNTVGKQNRASVKIVFDNTDKILPIDFEDVTIERVVHRDGSNEYLINKSNVRLKDINELLASVNIGSSGHHIISQGEADKILNSSVKERRAMLEDALGLRIFQIKKHESERKLVKTESNIEQVQSLRREISPHIKFLKKQVEKLEEGKRLKEELKDVYKRYLKIESVYLKKERARIDSEIKEPRERLSFIESEITKYESESREEETNTELTDKIKQGEGNISEINEEKSQLIRRMGNLEGQLSSLQKLKERAQIREEETSIVLSKEDIQTLKRETDILQSNLDNFETLREAVRRVLSLMKNILRSDNPTQDNNYSDDIQRTQSELNETEQKLQVIQSKEQSLSQEISQLRKQLEDDKSNSLVAEKKIIALMSEKNEIQKTISEFAIAEDGLIRDENAFKQEMTESVALVGREALGYESLEISAEDMSQLRDVQVQKRRDLERMKIKVEELGIGLGEETLNEYREVTERDSFLLSEIEDLEKSAVSLRGLITELEIQINDKFKEGLIKINVEFQKFFALMFGGGTAKLELVKIAAKKKKDTDVLSMDEDNFEEDQEAEEGIDISVNLPRKKIRDLMVLSGGERALTSIALLFAISQVNPPPFIVLDETDAALDEANSRKYSDMIENLSKYSQLILITHNRETMSRAGVLYGVTMIQGVSQLLSISFDDGTQYAK